MLRYRDEVRWDARGDPRALPYAPYGLMKPRDAADSHTEVHPCPLELESGRAIASRPVLGHLSPVAIAADQKPIGRGSDVAQAALGQPQADRMMHLCCLRYVWCATR